MALLHYLWSRTAGSNATADSAVNWAEGQAPSSVNDSARAMMASLAGYRDDIAGAIVTGGTSTAYTVTSYQVFDTLAHMGGQVISFTPHATNGASPSLNVDGLGAKTIGLDINTGVPAGTLIAGSPYTAIYSSALGIFILKDFYQVPYTVPIGAAIPYFGTTAPNSAFVLPYGQAVSRTTYATLFTLFSTTYGVGDGSTTFNIPDLRGRVLAGKDNMGGSSANRLTDADDGLNGDTLGDTGGGETQVLVTGNLPAYTPAGSVSVTSTSSTVLQSSGPADNWTSVAGAESFNDQTRSAITSTGTLTGTAQGGTSTAFGVVQPTIISNYILRVI